tara:strand:+ start:149 stop:763 length:615 start_codon:yes stop_codon:yes gene_type:complete
MILKEYYSHLNGHEWISHHHPDLWKEIKDVIESVDAINAKTKISAEKTMKGVALYDPGSINKLFKKEFSSRDWHSPIRDSFIYTTNQEYLRKIINLDIAEQRKILDANGIEYKSGSVQSDFKKERVSVEVQFGKYAFVQYDLHTKFVPQYMDNKIDVGIEIVPMKAMQSQMSSGPTNYERNLHEIFRQGRTSPSVPIILIGVEP